MSCRFFCALHPGMREAWAAGWARRIKPGGALVALCFPVTYADRMGPPWPVTVEDYENVLIPRGFVCAGIQPVEDADATTPARAGKEILTIWMKE
jgi:methyl halide transferase